MLARLRAWLHQRAETRAQQDALEILARIYPDDASQPQVSTHRRSAALHLQLAAEIGWRGPSAWRGR